MAKTIRIGFLGAGEFSAFHARALDLCPDCELTGLWNRNEPRRKERAEQFDCTPFPTAEALVESPDVDAVFVLTNLETHVQYAKLALDAGKHVFVEKPVAVRADEIEILSRTARDRGLVCMPGHNMIYEEGIRRIRDLVNSGRLGDIVSLHVMYNMHHSEEIASRYPGIIRQIFTHNLYSLMFVGGVPVDVCAMKSTIHYKELDREDLALAILRMKSGALAHISASFAADDIASDPWTFIIKVIGTGGSCRYTYQDWVVGTKDAFHSHSYEAYQGTVNNEDAHFLEICRDGGQPLSTLEDAIVAQRTLEAIEESIESSRIISIV